MANASAVVVDRGNKQFQGLFSEMWTIKATIDWGQSVDGAGETSQAVVPGVALGDMVIGISHNLDIAAVTLTGYVSAANTVTWRLQNESTATVDYASTTIKCLVVRPDF